MKREREFQAWVQISRGLQLRLLVLHRARRRAGARSAAARRRAGRGSRAPGRRRRARGHAARPERRTPTGATCRRAARRPFAELLGDDRRRRRHRAHPLHEPAPEGHARGRDPRARRAAERSASTSTCRCSRAPSRILKAMRRTYNRERYLDRVAMIREQVPDCAITTDIIVGFPGETEADFEQTLEVVEEVRYDSALHVHLLAAPRHRGGRAATTRSRTRSSASAWSGWSRPSSGSRTERAQRFVGRTMEVLVEGPSRTDPDKLRGRTRHNKTVNFAGLAQPGELAQVEITARPARRWRAKSRCSRARSLERGRDRHLRPHGGRQDGGGDRARRACCARAARIRSRSRPTRCRSTRASRRSRGAATRRGAGAAGAPPGRLRAGHAHVLGGEYMPLAHAEIDAALAARPAPDRGRAAPASTCARRSPSSTCSRRRPRRAGALDQAEVERRGPGGAAHRAARARARAAAGIAPDDRNRIVRDLELLEMGELEPRRRGDSQLWTEHTRHPTLLAGLTMEREGSTSGSTPGWRRWWPPARDDEVRARGRGRRLAHRAQGARLRGAARGRRRGDEAAAPAATRSASSPGCASWPASTRSTSPAGEPAEVAAEIAALSLPRPAS